ncbi:TolC family protein [Clostridiaceae bacterium]|nr:TolC family protein [Clostridiaceae bacterium]RKI16495.1 TolC family protein [bacterium 1XD21-70]
MIDTSKGKRKRRAAQALAAAVGMALLPFPSQAQQSPEFAYPAEKWASLRDDRLEYEEIADLVHEYNNTVLQNAISYRDEKDKNKDDVAQDYYDTANDIYSNIQYPDADDPNYGSQMSSVLNSRLQADQLMERGDESTEDSGTIKLGYDQAEANLVKQAQQQMIQYWSQYYSLDSLRQKKVQAENSYQSEQNRLAAGMSTQAKVLSAKEAVSSAEASILSAESSLGKTKESLALMLGWKYGAEVEIGELPEPDLAQIGAIDIEADIQKALANNYSLKLTERRLKNARTEKVKNTQEQTQKNQRETIAANVKAGYDSLLLARSNYEQAVQAFELEQVSMASAERKLAAGTITRNEYQSQQTSYLNAEVSVLTQKLALLTAMVDYQWSVDGLAQAS